jgi:hypothetical protein
MDDSNMEGGSCVFESGGSVSRLCKSARNAQALRGFTFLSRLEILSQRRYGLKSVASMWYACAPHPRDPRVDRGFCVVASTTLFADKIGCVVTRPPKHIWRSS